MGIQIHFDRPLNLTTGKSLIIVANHQSTYDIPPIIWYLKKFHPKFISKKQLGRGIPGVSYNLRNGGSVLIDRSRPEESLGLIKIFAHKLERNKWSAVIFPEGTRQAPNNIGAIKPGVFLIQERLKRPIFPVFIDSGKTWPRNSLKIEKKNILVKSLKPIPYGLKKTKFKEILKKSFEES